MFVYELLFPFHFKKSAVASCSDSNIICQRIELLNEPNENPSEWFSVLARYPQANASAAWSHDRKDSREVMNPFSPPLSGLCEV